MELTAKDAKTYAKGAKGFSLRHFSAFLAFCKLIDNQRLINYFWIKNITFGDHHKNWAMSQTSSNEETKNENMNSQLFVFLLTPKGSEICRKENAQQNIRPRRGRTYIRMKRAC